MTDTADNVVPLRRAKGKCPLCGRPSVAEHRPFCSTRCADRDLANWFDGRYAIPAGDADGEAPDEAPDEAPNED